MTGNEIELELLPWERAVLLKWNHTPEVRSQLEAYACSNEVESITIARYVLGWLSSDLNHAIVKRDCGDTDAIELSERLDYAEQSGDDSLKGWH